MWGERGWGGGGHGERDVETGAELGGVEEGEAGVHDLEVDFDEVERESAMAERRFVQYSSESNDAKRNETRNRRLQSGTTPQKPDINKVILLP